MSRRLLQAGRAGPVTGDGGAWCRFCGDPLRSTFVDLGMSPLCETFPGPDELDRMEPFYPLHARVCERCFLVQVGEFVSPEEIFSDDYPYLSSYSDSWLRHAERYVAAIIDRLRLGAQSRVVEVGSNDGYLLHFFVGKGIPVLGIDPSRRAVDEAHANGIPTRREFFGIEMAKSLRAEGLGADLIVGNNVLAQVPDLNGFVAGMKVLLNPGGTITMEFPHLVRLVEQNQFDTIYHEHFSYLSFVTARDIFSAHGLTLVDVEELPSHGGSLRIYACHAEEGAPVCDRARELVERESSTGVHTLEYYRSFDERVKATKRDILRFLIDANDRGETVAGYGAPGKGNTLLNYCGIGTDLLEYTVDRNPVKHGRFTPGAHVPIHPPDRLYQTRPDFVFILPWNLKDEIMAQLGGVREWGGRFVVPIPEVTLYP